MRKIIGLLIFSSLFIICASSAIANSILFIEEGKHRSDEIDTPLTSRIMSVMNANRLLLEKMVAHFEVEPEIKMIKLTKDQVSALALIAFRPEIIDEGQVCEEYYVRSKVIADNRFFIQYVGALQREPEKMKAVEQLKKRSDDLFSEAAKRKSELTAMSIIDRDQNMGPYMQAISELDAMDDFNRGYSDALLFGKHREAIDAFTRAISRNPNHHAAYYHRGFAYLKLNESDRAARDFETAMSLVLADIEPNDRSISNYKNVESMVKEKDDPKKVIAIMDKAVGVNPNDADAFYNRGTAYLVLGKFDKAISDFNRAIALKPHDFDYYYNRKVATQQSTATDQWVKLPPSAEELQRRRRNDRERAAELAAKAREEEIAERRERLEIERERLELERKRASIAPYGNNNVAPSISRGAIDVHTGQYFPPAGGGVIDPRTGTFHVDVGGGYVNTRTGEFSPKIGP